jgi:hypothetical protein
MIDYWTDERNSDGYSQQGTEQSPPDQVKTNMHESEIRNLHLQFRSFSKQADYQNQIINYKLDSMVPEQIRKSLPAMEKIEPHQDRTIESHPPSEPQEAKSGPKPERTRCKPDPPDETPSIALPPKKEKGPEEAQILKARDIIHKLIPGTTTAFEIYCEQMQSNDGQLSSPELSDKWSKLTSIEKQTFHDRADFRRREWQTKYDRFQSRLTAPP